MKNKILLSVLTPVASIAAISGVTMSLTSCNNQSTVDNITIDGNATYDAAITSVELKTTSIIALVANDGYEITSIKSVQVGSKTLQKSSYSFDSETCELTIQSYAMTSIKVKVEVETEVTPSRELVSIQSVQYTVENPKVGAYLNKYNLVVTGLYSDHNTKKLTIDTEYKIFNNGNDVTSLIKSGSGFQFTEAGIYYFVAKAGKDWSKPLEFTINVAEA